MDGIQVDLMLRDSGSMKATADVTMPTAWGSVPMTPEILLAFDLALRLMPGHGEDSDWLGHDP